MKWRPILQRFGMRFAICLTVLGAVYLAVFGHSLQSHNKHQTAREKVIALRAAVDQSYLASNSLAGFSQNDPLSYYSLGSLGGQFQTNNTILHKRLASAGGKISPELQQQIKEFLGRQQQTAADFNTGYGLLSRVIAYDPTTDLGTVDISGSAAKLSQRAAAAQNALKKIAGDSTPVSDSSNLTVQPNSGTPLLSDAATREALLKEAGCFGRLAAQVDAKQAAAAQTRTSCINDYPAVRQLAITNVIHTALPDTQQQYLKQTVPRLVKQLDSSIAHSK